MKTATQKGSSFNRRMAGLHPADEGATPSGSTNPPYSVAVTSGSAFVRPDQALPLGAVNDGTNAVTVHLRVPERLANELQLKPTGPCSMCGAPDYDGWGHPTGGWIAAMHRKCKGDWCIGPFVKAGGFYWQTTTTGGEARLWQVDRWRMEGDHDSEVWSASAWVQEKNNGKKNGRKKSK